ncbi:inositol monophosphatase family protein [Halalkalibacter hemicellulosilyticus]|uniref:Inositol-1-monophosphatase n=1 Tax=Halalkalibacter hemicellulosilyticusJCM 9152 TaxID=1236971 RepID=W4QCD1_9BACI|nr:inositol-1-monophosphatase [Halalkalibacter hemicellulosilyticusJCM 9152]
MNKQWNERFEKIQEWVQIAGEEQVKRMDDELKIEQKSANIDLVTEMDVWTDEFFQENIRTFFPSDAILSEEAGASAGESGYEWVIDPIDGTTNYAHRFPMFAISVAVKYEGETVVGVVHAPKLGESYTALKGKGAYLNGKKIIVSERTQLTDSVIATGFPYDRATDPLNNVEQFNAVILQIGGIRRTGSAALDLCQVAAGRFEGYWEYKINPWDFEAGVLIVKEAGGVIVKKH